MAEDHAGADEHAPEHPVHPVHPEGTAPFLPDAWWRLPPHRRRHVAGALALTVVALTAVGAFVLLRGGDGDDAAEPAAGATTTVDAAAYVAALPDERVRTWDAIAQCETNGNWSEDSGNGFYGGLQFTLDSWQAVGGTGNPAQASQDEQIMRAQMLQQEQGWNAWPACSAQLGLT